MKIIKSGFLGILTGCLLLVAQNISAQDNNFNPAYPLYRPYVAVGMGASVYPGGKTYDVNYSLPIFGTSFTTQYNDLYVDAGKHSIAGIISVHAGYEFNLLPYINVVSFGLGFYDSTPYTGHGKLWSSINNSAQQNYFDYKYNWKAWRIMAEVTFGYRLKNFFPFVTVGAGPAFINADHYSETATQSPSPVTASSTFADNSNTHLAYQIGLGVGYYVGENNRLSLSYHYVNLGDVEFGNRNATGYQYRLDLGQAKTHDVVFSFTHLF